MLELNEVDTRLSVHEAICAERYIGINAQLRRIEMVLLSTAGALILGLAAVAWSMVAHR
jgi:hypothetical protein